MPFDHEKGIYVADESAVGYRLACVEENLAMRFPWDRYVPLTAQEKLEFRRLFSTMPERGNRWESRNLTGILVEYGRDLKYDVKLSHDVHFKFGLRKGKDRICSCRTCNKLVRKGRACVTVSLWTNGSRSSRKPDKYYVYNPECWDAIIAELHMGEVGRKAWFGKDVLDSE